MLSRKKHDPSEAVVAPLHTGASSDDAATLTPADVRRTTPPLAHLKFFLVCGVGLVLAAVAAPLSALWYVAAPFVLLFAGSLPKLEQKSFTLYPLSRVSATNWGSLAAIMGQPLVGINLPENKPVRWPYLAVLPLALPMVVVPVVAAAFSADIFTLVTRYAAAYQFAAYPHGAGALASWRIAFLFATLLALKGGARVAAYTYELESFQAAAGEKLRYWFHGNGLWTASHEELDAMMRSPQERGVARAGFFLLAPDVFAQKLLIFLSNPSTPDSEWAAIRAQAHKLLFVPARARSAEIERRVRADWRACGNNASPSVADLKDAQLVNRLVVKSLFYAMFGKWIDDEDAAVMTGWRDLAGVFVMPRVVQRLLLNSGAQKLGALRIKSAALARKYELEGLFSELNDGLGKWKRVELVDMVDQIMYLVGFAGIGGTAAATSSMGSILEAEQSADGGSDGIDYGGKSAADMRALYHANEKAFIMEACRLSSPVGTFTNILRQTTAFPMLGNVPAGTPVSGVINVANRDAAVFAKPSHFDPSRRELSKALTWNGQAFGPNEAKYPRLCPGRELSLTIVTAIVNVAVSAPADSSAPV